MNEERCVGVGGCVCVWVCVCVYAHTFAAEDGEALYSLQKQDQELTVAQMMNYLLQIQT